MADEVIGAVQPATGNAARPAVDATVGPTERRVAVALIALFLLALVGLFLLRDDANWDRLVFLFGALQALVFAGAGALFGTSVQRGNLADARADAAAARASADAARDEAQAQGKEAEKGRALADALRAAGEALLAQLPPSERRGAREDELEPPAATRPQELAQLVGLADRLFPPTS
jgi:hypothetical protein